MRNWIIVFFVIFAARLSAHDGDSIKITHGPYLCDMSTDGVTVVWTTNKPALSWVEVAPAGEDHFYGKERPRYYDTESGRKRANDTIHRVRIKHLEPGREYRYRIFSREVVSWPSSDWVTYGLIAASNVYKQEPFRFRTFDDRKKEISFLVLNDIHGRSDYMKSLCREVDFKSLDFVLLNGDMSSWVEGQEQICKDYIDACVELFASEVPIVFNRGNHETRGVYSDALIKYFPTSTGTFYYRFNIGKVCFLVLDSGEDKPDSDLEYAGIADYDNYREEETLWLRSVVEENDFKQSSLRIAFLHIPPTIGNWHGNYHLQQTLLPVLNTAGIDLMLSGHTHKYYFRESEPDKANFPILVNDNNSYLLCKIKDGKMVIYLHGAKKGYKYDLIEKNPKVCFEMECDVVPFEGKVACQYGNSYSCVMGKGKAVIVEDVNEKMQALSILMKCQTGGDFTFNEELVSIVNVIRIDVSEFSAKRRPVPEGLKK